MLLAELGHTEVEGGVVDEYEYIGLLLQQRLLGNTEIALDLMEILQDSYDAHIRHVAVIHAYVASLGTHLVATESDERGLRIFCTQGFDEIGGM